MQIVFGDKGMENILEYTKEKWNLVQKYSGHHALRTLVNSILAKAIHSDVKKRKEVRYLILKPQWNFDFSSFSLTINCRQVDSSWGHEKENPLKQMEFLESVEGGHQRPSLKSHCQKSLSVNTTGSTAPHGNASNYSIVLIIIIIVL